MTPDQVRRIQRRLVLLQDGQLGRVTLAAIFMAAGAGAERSAELALSGVVHMPVAGIMDTPLRLAHFMAQTGHESGGFKWMEEIASGQAYEGRADLGNTVKGDGPRYKGRGVLQLTGRANYKAVGRDIGIDLESHPEIVAYPSVGLWIACIYWLNRGLNQLADEDDLSAVTRRINGGQIGAADRAARLAKMKELLL